MNNLQRALQELINKPQKKPALMTHVVLGYPSLRESIELVKEQVKAGAQFVELQIPFSDPMADGPTIMNACQAALAGGVKVRDCFFAAQKLASSVPVPLLFMTYFNIVHHYKGGTKAFCRDSQAVGISGIIVPDISIDDEVERYWDLALRHKLSPIPIASPVTPLKRLKKMAPLAKQGFVYCQSTTSTTGAKDKLPQGLTRYLDRVRSNVKSPLAVGFGISKPEHIEFLKNHTDIAIVGSACLNIFNKVKTNPRMAVGKFVHSLCK